MCMRITGLTYLAVPPPESFICTAATAVEELQASCCVQVSIVPALPEKNVVQKYQMTTEFIEIRRRALAVYLNKVVWSLQHAEVNV